MECSTKVILKQLNELVNNTKIWESVKEIFQFVPDTLVLKIDFNSLERGNIDDIWSVVWEILQSVSNDDIKNIEIDLKKLEKKSEGWEIEWEKIYNTFSQNKKEFLHKRLCSYYTQLYLNSDDENKSKKVDIYEIDEWFFKLFTFCSNRLTLDDSIGLEIGEQKLTLDNLFSEQNIHNFLNKAATISIADLCINQELLEKRNPGWKKEYEKLSVFFSEHHFIKRELNRSSVFHTIYNYSRKSVNFLKKAALKNKKNKNADKISIKIRDEYKNLKLEKICEWIANLKSYADYRWGVPKASEKPSSKQKIEIKYLFSSRMISYYLSSIHNNKKIGINTENHYQELQSIAIREASKYTDKKEIEAYEHIFFTQSFDQLLRENDNDDFSDNGFPLNDDDTPQNLVYQDKKWHEMFNKDIDILKWIEFRRYNTLKVSKQPFSMYIENYYKIQKRDIFTNETANFHAGIQLYPLYYSVSVEEKEGSYFLYKTTMDIVQSHIRDNGENEAPDARLRRLLIIGREKIEKEMNDLTKQKNESNHLKAAGEARLEKKIQLFNFMKFFNPIFLKEARQELGFSEVDAVKNLSSEYNELLKKIFKNRKIVPYYRDGMIRTLIESEIPEINETIKQVYFRDFDKNDDEMDDFVVN